MYRTSQNLKIIKVYLESLLSESFPALGIPVHLASLGCPPTLLIMDLLWGSSDSHLALLLGFLASSVHSYQSWCVFFCGRSQWPFIYSIDTESA